MSLTARTNRTTGGRSTTSDAAKFRHAQMSGSSVSSILQPIDGYRGELARKGIKPKDHFRENIVAMREKQRENKMRRELASLEEQAGAFKLKRFSGVESKIASTTRGGDTARGDLSSRGSGRSSGTFLRKHEGVSAATVKKTVPRSHRPPRESAKPRVPRVEEALPAPRREHKDFVKANYHDAPRATPSRRDSDDTDSVRHEEYGHVPRYLQDRKAMWAEEEEHRREEALDECPPGMTVMPDEERLETLGVLQSSLEETNQLLYRMPLKIETQGQIRRKAELDAKVKELEDAIEIFSRDQVYVAEDE